jgi:crotonobetainyl-CoA:carnitine CoA-transferase CaiB-like acyl-CoA transferase
MSAIGRDDLTGPDYAQNHHRVARQAEIEAAICEWTRTRTAEEVEVTLRVVSVPCGRVFSVKEVVENPHTEARGLVEEVWVGDKKREKGWTVKMSKAVPLLEGVDTSARWTGPDLGQHNEEVLCGELGLSKDELQDLQKKGVIGQ